MLDKRADPIVEDKFAFTTSMIRGADSGPFSTMSLDEDTLGRIDSVEVTFPGKDKIGDKVDLRESELLLGESRNTGKPSWKRLARGCITVFDETMTTPGKHKERNGN